MDETPEQIEAAIAALEAQRAVLGDAVVGMALGALRERLAEARSRARQVEQRLKTVTVLFADVVGSTAIGRQLDPEDIHALMDGALAQLTRIVEAQHGRVLQYAGDSLLAVFGAEEAHEDDAERAVRAGLGLIDAVPAIAAQTAARHGLAGLDLRVGIHTGPVLLGGGVDAEHSIRGMTVNIAARMEQSAPPGKLRISQDTYRQVRGVFEVNAQPPIELKGLDAPVRSYLVVRAKPRQFRVANRGVEGVETRMIGRDAELARLTEAFETAIDEQSLVVVTVAGDAGLGKSRLLFEFDHWLELRPGTLNRLHGRPQPYGQNVPYGLLRDMLAWRFEILESDSQALAQAKLAQGLAPLFGERAAEQTALIGELIGLDYGTDAHIAGIDARQIRDRGFHAAIQYLRLLHRQSGAPIVMLLDDLHWADEGSLDFVNHVAQACADLPLLLLCLTRPTLFERRPLWGSGQQNHERIDLAPLSRRSSRELADALLQRLDTVPAALRDLLIGSAEGNPYFVEELVGMLIDDGVILTGPERWQVVPDKLLKVHVPSTLAGVLQARLDGLPAAEKAALQQASVIGHVFWDEALQRIAPASAEALAPLTRRELAQGRETTAFEGVREYVFKHHVLHQVTYDSVLKRHKREHHHQVADWLVLRSGERASEYFGLIAEHYERAGDATQAVRYFRQAGEDAARSYANHAALDHFTRALAMVPADDPETRFQLLLCRREVLGSVGRRVEQAADVAALEELADAMGDDEKRARAAGLRAAQALVTADYAAAAVAAQRSVALADAAGVPAAALQARMNWARALQFQGDYPAAQARTEEALALTRSAAGQQGDSVAERRLETAALNQLGILAVQVGRYFDALGYYDQALQLARRTGDRTMEGAALNNLGDIQRYLGNHDAALALLKEGQRVAEETGRRVNEAYLLCTMAQVAAVCGSAIEALDWAGKALTIAQQASERDLEASIECVRGHAFAEIPRHDDALTAYGAALAIYREIGRPTMHAEPLAGLARVAHRQGRSGDALAHVAEIVAHLDSGGSVDGTEDPMWIHLTCHEVLAAVDAARSIEFLRRGHQLLMQRAGLLGEGERTGFLGNVPTHRALLAAWRAAGEPAV